VQPDCTVRRGRRIHFPAGGVQTTAPSPQAQQRPWRTSPTEPEHRRSRTNCDRAGRAGVPLVCRHSRIRRHVMDGARARRNDGDNGQRVADLRIRSLDVRHSDPAGYATTAQTASSSEVPHRRQFWQRSQFVIDQNSLTQFRKKSYKDHNHRPGDMRGRCSLAIERRSHKSLPSANYTYFLAE